MKPWTHQQKSINFFQALEKTLDASDPGTGKTFVALTLFAKRRSKGGGKMLILAPKTLLESVWVVDAHKFYPSLRMSVSTAPDREKGFAADADVYITNTDASKWLAKQKPAFFKEFDTLCIDELSYYKHRTSARSKAVKSIRPMFKYIHGMTGTPKARNITDIWHQLMILDGGERLGQNYHRFQTVTCTPKQVGPSPRMVKWVDKPGINSVIAELIGDITMRHKFEACMDIPKNHMYTIPYTLTRRNMKQYETMREEALLILKEGDVTAVNQAVMRTKLLQIAAGCIYTEEGSTILDTGRAELVADLVEQRKHSIVFFNWRHQKQQLINEMEKRKIKYACIDGSVPKNKRAEIVSFYQAGAFQVLFLHPRTGAHGLTLTKGTATIFASPIYEPDVLKQAMHRIYRGGQTKKTETIFIEAVDTVESKVYQMLFDGKTSMDSLLELLE